MRSIPLMMTIIGIAFSLVILGVYLYQTAPENNTTNLPESASVVLPAVDLDEDASEETSGEASGETSEEVSEEASAENQSDEVVPEPVLTETVSLTVELVNVSPDGTVVISGHAAPHSQISILIDENMMATAKANAKGDWVAVPDHPLTPGSHLLTIRSKDANGVETMADMAVIIVIPDSMDEAPLVALVPVDEASDQMAQLLSSPFIDEGESQIIVSDAPVVTPELSQDLTQDDYPTTEEVEALSAEPAVTEPAVVIPRITIRMIEAISPERMAVSGFVEGEGSVKVSIDNVVATTTVDDDGYMAQGDIPSKDRFPVAVMLSDADGALLSSARIVLNKSKLDETLSDNALIVVQKGDALWRIAYKTYGQGIRYVDI
jgi:hypothetical protein